MERTYYSFFHDGLGIDNKLRSKNRRTVRYFLTDHLGSTEALTDSTGKVVSSTSYDSFGNATSNITTTYRYTGREYDVDTGLYYYRNRWYDPELGRFISEDPIGFASGDINLYGYVGNNPYGYIDPFGFRGCVPSDPPGEDPPLSWWDAFQGALDVVGLAPVVGLPADLLNAGISVARGNYGDAAFSMAAAVPVLGTVAGAGKLAKTANKLTKGGVYKLTDLNTGKVMKTGRTKDLARRRKEHARNPKFKDFEYKAAYKTDNYFEQRGLEEVVYKKYDAPYDLVAPISSRNKRKDIYRKAAKDFLKKQ